jgi:hypothetical protein
MSAGPLKLASYDQIKTSFQAAGMEDGVPLHIVSGLGAGFVAAGPVPSSFPFQLSVGSVSCVALNEAVRPCMTVPC